jgi:hypothetical protein
MMRPLTKYLPAIFKNNFHGSINEYRPAISALAYFFVFLFSFRYGQAILAGGDSWKTGDWLINYEGGFVRRGLIGQVLYELSGLGFNLLWSAFVLQTAIYILIAHYTLKLFFATERGTAWLLFLFSPAFIFLFPLYGIEGGFRKEILLFLSFCLLAYGLLDNKVSHKHVIVSLLVYCVAVFSHELAAPCLVFIVYLLIQAKKNTSNRAAINAYILFFILTGVTGGLLALVKHGNLEVQHQICNSLLIAGLKGDICGGAIAWLQYDTHYGIRQVAAIFKTSISVYPFLFAMAFLPFLLTDWCKKTVFILVLGFAALLPLYIVALDWGRWIHIYIFMISTILLLESANTLVTIRRVSLLGVFLYACIWSIPHVNAQRPGFGMFEFSYKVLTQVIL